MEKDKSTYGKNIKLKDGSIVKLDKIFKSIPYRNIEIILSTRKKPRVLPFLKREEIGFCVFREYKPEKYVSYSTAKYRLKKTERTARRDARSAVINVDYYYDYLRDDAKKVLEKMKRIKKGESKIEDLAKYDIFFDKGLRV